MNRMKKSRKRLKIEILSVIESRFFMNPFQHDCGSGGQVEAQVIPVSAACGVIQGKVNLIRRETVIPAI